METQTIKLFSGKTLEVRITQVPGELAQYNGWTGPQLLAMVAHEEAENKRLKHENKSMNELERIAAALESIAASLKYNPDDDSQCNFYELIRQLNSAICSMDEGGLHERPSWKTEPK